jgi:hypothetical protein
MPNGLEVTGATVAVGQTGFLYSWFLPSLREVRQATADDRSMRGDVLMGQIAAGSVSVTVGVLLSWMTGSSIPALTTLFVAALIGAIYSYAMNSTRPMEK